MAAVWFVHWPVLYAQAVTIDDQQYLINNVIVQQPDLRSVTRVITEVLTPSTVNGYYQPLTMLSLMLDSVMGGSTHDLYVYHRTSLLLHSMNTMIIVIILYRLFGSVSAAVLTGVIFGVHPLTVEPVAWVSDRKTLLSTCFSLISILGYLKYAHQPRITSFGVSLTAYILAVLSKPTSTPLPILLMLLDFWPLQRLSSRALIEKIPWLIVGVISGVLTIVSQSRTGGVHLYAGTSMISMLYQVTYNVPFYIYKMIWPSNLSAIYPYPQPFTAQNSAVIAGLLGTVLLIAMTAASFRYTRALATGMLFYVIALLPATGVIGFAIVVAADKYAYLPSLGILLVLAWAFERVWNMSSETRRHAARWVLFSGAIVAVMFYSIATRRYLAQWSDSYSLYSYMLPMAPNNPTINSTLAVELADRGQFLEAVQKCQRAIDTDPEYADAYVNMGYALARLKRFQEAIPYLEKAVHLREGHVISRLNLANGLTALGRNEEAMYQYKMVLKLQPDFPEAHCNLGLLLLNAGQYREAEQHCLMAVKYNPGESLFAMHLGNVYARSGQYDKAVECYKRAIQLDPSNGRARISLNDVQSGHDKKVLDP